MNHTEKPLGTLLAETKAELKEFLETRFQILRAELQEKITAWKYSIPFLAIAAVMLLTAWVTLTFSLLVLIHTSFVPSEYAWLWAGLIVTGVYALLGLVIGGMGYGHLTSVGIKPKRTLQVLKEDQVWIQNEARTS